MRTVWLPALALLQLLLLLVTLLYSWVANLYGVQVQNLLSTDGVRWILRHVMQNYQQLPILHILLVLMGWGVLSGSGWLESCGHTFRRRFSQMAPRQRWGFQVSWIAVFLYILILSSGFMGSEPVLLSVTGTLGQSPLIDGIMVIILIGIMLMGGSYAWISGKCSSVLVFAQYMAQGVAQGAMLFLNLFLLGQQIGFIQFILSY